MVFVQISTIVIIFLSLSAKGLPSWITPPTKSFVLAQNNLSTKTGDYFKRRVKRLGNQEIELEGFASIMGDLNHFYQIAQNVPRYRKWALDHINTRLNGKAYLIKILDLNTSTKNKEELTATFGLELPFLKMKIDKRFLIKSEKNSHSSTVYCQSLNPPDSILSSLKGFITAFKHPEEPGRLWVYFKGQTRLTNWLLYQAIPEKVLAGESAERIHTVLDNFSAEEIKYPLNGIKSP